MPQGPIPVAVARAYPNSTVSQAVGTIAATGTFQAALLANSNRIPGGAIVNLGTHAMNVVFGSHTTAVVADAIPIPPASTIAPAGTLSFATFFGGSGSGGNYTGEVAIEGTAADTFVTVENS
jgi:hypothetical protein